MPAARYEILLPLKYNDGSDIEPAKLLQTKEEIVQTFGALTVDPHPLQGIWTHRETSYQDTLLKYIVDVEDDNEDVQEFFRKLKDVLKARFRQLDIWIVAYPIRRL